MKKLFFLTVCTIASTLVSAQPITVQDSLSMKPGNVQDVYYNLKSGNKDTVIGNNWHIAFSVRPSIPPSNTMQGATVKINDGRGTSLYKSNFTSSNWEQFDTAGWKTWKQTYNGDTSWDIGAFNDGYNFASMSVADYGWGTYTYVDPSHNVIGTKVFLAVIGTSNFKKICIQRNEADTQWVFSFSNIDGSDSNSVTIKKKEYAGKLFAYYNLITKTAIDREPSANSWDLLFTKYKAPVSLGGPPVMYPVVGVLQNPKVQAAKYFGGDIDSVGPKPMPPYSKNCNILDWTWKEIAMAPGNVPIVDSLAFFVKSPLDTLTDYKIIFTNYFANSTRQNIAFKKTIFMRPLLGLNETIEKSNQFLVYPNPANEVINISISNFENKVSGNAIVSDITGKELAKKEINNATNFDLSGFGSGIYFIKIEWNGKTEFHKFIKQ